MTHQVTATTAKATLLALLDEVESGDQVEITRHGRTVARLVPAKDPQGLKGMFAGIVRSAATDDELFSTGERWESE